jgi:hypothetical protein
MDAREMTRCANAMGRSDAVFVFGSNREGVHGAGAAKAAAKFYGAQRGEGEGYFGRSYAIPTKQYWHSESGLPLHVIAEHVERFLDFAHEHPELTFVVTRIGCGYAGYTDEQIAPLFVESPLHCQLPPAWLAVIRDLLRRPSERSEKR